MWRSVVEPVATTYCHWYCVIDSVAWEDTATYPPLSIRGNEYRRGHGHANVTTSAPAPTGRHAYLVGLHPGGNGCPQEHQRTGQSVFPGGHTTSGQEFAVKLIAQTLLCTTRIWYRSLHGSQDPWTSLLEQTTPQNSGRHHYIFRYRRT